MKKTLPSKRTILNVLLLVLILFLLTLFPNPRDFDLSAEQSGGSPESGTDSTIKTLYDLIVSYNQGSDSSGSWGDWGNYWNRIRSSVTDYSQQKNLIYDDWKGESTDCVDSLADAYSEGEDQCKEEGDWTDYTDGSLGSETIASGNVFKDNRTGLYWSDCYSSDQDGSCDTVADNEFDLDGEIADEDDGLDAEGGAAVDFCENLELDADGTGGDDTDWYLPSQKELMQAYINGCANNIDNPAHFFWSSTERYNNSVYAWSVDLYRGGTSYCSKGNSGYYARCVRRD